MTRPSFSAANRSLFIDHLNTQQLDILVIGGGITGAGIALDASSRGLKVALIDKQDFAAGTSSRSTKLIHGGLRYLKQMEIGLVMEVGREREIVYKNAPHLVIPEKMLLPVIEGGSLGKFSTSIGLYVYDMLAGVKAGERRKMLSKEATIKQEPLLRTDILKAGALYIEYRTDDSRLVIETIKEAVNRGATCINYMNCEGFEYDNGKIKSAKAKDIFTGKEINIKADYIINATGPWVDEIREMDNSLKGKRLHLTKGVHLVFNYETLPLKQSMYFDAPGGRMVFAIPRDGCTYLGTTDTNYTDQKNRPQVTQDDVDYLLKAANGMFANRKLSQSDIVSSWAGLRPLIHEDGKSPSELSRKDEIFESPSGLLSIAGGKLTGYRKMSERITNLVMARIVEYKVLPFKACETKHIPLAGGFTSSAEVESFTQKLFNEAKQLNYTQAGIQKLVQRYGKKAQEVVNNAYTISQQIEKRETAPLLAEIDYGIQNEMVCMPADFFIRRTGMLYFDRSNINLQQEILSSALQSSTGLSEEILKAGNVELNEELNAVVGF